MPDKPAQQRDQNQHHHANARGAPTQYAEHLAVARVSLQRGTAAVFRHQAGDIACQHRSNAGDHHPAAHHDALITRWRQFADHRVTDRGNHQFADALQHVTDRDPFERHQPVAAGQANAQRQHQHAQPDAKQRTGELHRNIDIAAASAQAIEPPGHQRATHHDHQRINVLDPLRRHLNAINVQIDIVLGEQHQPHWGQLIQRPKHQRA
ncbi:hypothetical protein D3C80_965060 [compost metagenome]